MADAKKTMPSLRDMRLLLLCWSGLIVARLALLLISYRRLAPLFSHAAKVPPPPLVRRIEAALITASRFVPASTCLVQACAMRGLLALNGYGVTMRVGVRTAPDGKLAAHAWLLSGEQVILGGHASDFSAYRALADFS